MVAIGQKSLSCFCLFFMQVPHAKSSPLLSRNCCSCSFTGNRSLLMSSASTPLFTKNTFTRWCLPRVTFANLKAFHTSSGSFVLTTMPIFKRFTNSIETSRLFYFSKLLLRKEFQNAFDSQSFLEHLTRAFRASLAHDINLTPWSGNSLLHQRN